MKRFFINFIIFILMSKAFSQGLEINYKDFTFVDVELGKLVALEPELRITNTGEIEREVSLKVVRLQDEYYSPIPNPWYIQLPEDFVLGPGETKAVTVNFQAPKEIKNFNRQWIAGIEVESRASKWEPFAISAIVALRIETEAGYIYEQVTPVAPTIIHLSPNDKFYFWLANLTFLPETLEIVLAPPYQADFIQRKIGYNRTVPFIRLEKRQVVVKEGERVRVSGRIQLPPTYDGEKIENLVLLWNKKAKEKGFIRVLIENQGGVEDEK